MVTIDGKIMIRKSEFGKNIVNKPFLVEAAAISFVYQ
jgi:hypothetical protein